MAPQHRPARGHRYRIVPYLEVDAPAERAAELTRLAFSDYPGVLQPSLAHTTWYLQRPGMDRYLSRAVWDGDRLVGSVFVCVTLLRLGGHLRLVGILDTVMVHPEHRRRGLARRMLADAVGAMRARDLQASLLYTKTGSPAYRLYESLGYRAHVTVDTYHRVQDPDASPAQGVRRATAADEAAVVALLNKHWANADGYVPLDGPLWRWRKMERPPELPAEVWVIGQDGAHRQGDLLGCVSVCRAPIVGAPEAMTPQPDHSYVLTDLAVAPGVGAEATVRALLSGVPACEETVILSAATDAPTNRLLAASGFEQEAGEVAMVLSLDWRLEASLYGAARRWYVLAESVIGV